MKVPAKSAQEWQRAAQKAATLAEALPWMKKYRDTIIVVKYGGNAMTEESLKQAFAEDIVFLRYAGFKPVVVHGGGPQINFALNQYGIESEFRGGLRVTTPETMEVVRMVLVDEVGRELVDLLNQHGEVAIGMSGEDGGLLTATKTFAEVDGKQVDIGLVGEVISVHPQAVLDCVDAGRIPVISTVACDESGQILNVNADTAAAALAAGLHAEKLLILTDVEGLFVDWPHSHDVYAEISPDDLEEIVPTLSEGMIPKMRATLAAVKNGVSRATVVDGREPHAVLLEIFTDDGVGTQVLPGAKKKIRTARQA